MISERTKAALAAAKARGVVLGGNRGKLASSAPAARKASILARRHKAQRSSADLMPVIEEIRAEGIASFGGIAIALNDRGIQAPKGGCWHPNSVRRVLACSKFT